MLTSSSLPSTVAHEHLKERSLFGLPPPPPGASSADYYHHLMASHRSPYGELLMQGAGASAATAAAAAAAHLPDYINPMDGELQHSKDRENKKRVETDIIQYTFILSCSSVGSTVRLS